MLRGTITPDKPGVLRRLKIRDIPDNSGSIYIDIDTIPFIWLPILRTRLHNSLTGIPELCHIAISRHEHRHLNRRITGRAVKN